MFPSRQSWKYLVWGLVFAVCTGFAATGSTAEEPWIDVSPINFPHTSEDGSTITLTFTMRTQPTADVTLSLYSNVLTEGTVSPSSVTFTPDTWNTPRTATVTGVDDMVRDYSQAYMIFVGPAVSDDPDYDGLQPANVPMINLDDDFGHFYTLAPCRLFDSREIKDGPALSSDVTRIVTAHGACGIPSNAAAIAVNVTVAHPSAAGHLTLHSGDKTVPLASTVSFGPAQTRSSNLSLRINRNGTLSISPVVAGNGTVHVILDVAGYFD
ncbi:MAG TPA: hypothetical protein VNM67_25655 [Thermoanaerobaculia bacterium]|jgi:hypothetical protein|nr:hypothetical protein [Thermoanaerobaculia bacterium]